MRMPLSLPLALVFLMAVPRLTAAQAPPGARIQFDIRIPDSLAAGVRDGRLILMLSTDSTAEPRFQIADGPNTQLAFGRNLESWKPGRPHGPPGTPVTIGYEFFRHDHTFHNSPANNSTAVPPMSPLGANGPGTYVGTLRYRVSNIVYNAEYNRYTYYYDSDFHDHYESTWRYVNRPNYNPIACDAHFSKNWGAWQTFDSSDPDQITNPGIWACTGPHHVPEVTGGFGPMWTEYQWLEFSGTSCPDEYGSDNFPPNANQWTKLTQVDSAKCYDWSTYYYPADGGNNKPAPGVTLK